MDTVARKRLRLLEFYLPCGCGSRKAAGPESWFTETSHLALDSAAARQIEEVSILYWLRVWILGLSVAHGLGAGASDSSS